MMPKPPITRNSDICQTIAFLPEKFIVDFANGIDVTKDHLRLQRSREGFFARLYDGFTGQGSRRQTEINASLSDGVNASLQWLTELSQSVAKSNLAISCVNDRLNALKQDSALIANYSADTRQQLDALTLYLSARCDNIEQEVSRIDFIQRVQLNLDYVFNKWQAGRYQNLSLSGRCYAALEELHWGAFGDYYRRHTARESQHFIEDLANRAIVQLANDAKQSTTARLNTHRWLNLPVDGSSAIDTVEALAYIGERFQPQQAPFAFSITQQPSNFPLELPRISSAERIAEALVSEVFWRDHNE